MPSPDARLYFDFVDPLSYLVELALLDLEARGGVPVERVGYELRPPPAPLTHRSDAIWAPRWDAARRSAPTARLDPPALVPWTRKAHELHILAGTRGAAANVRRGVFEAHFVERRDIGRIDELVRIAVATGLDGTEAKAVLDVGTHEEDLAEARRVATALGVTDLPALVVRGKLVEGFHNLTDLGTLVGGPLGGGR
jgi:predicted DsbA family dithiol-disulfide isomerase